MCLHTQQASIYYVMLMIWKGFNQAVKTGLLKQVINFPDQGFLSIFGKFKLPYEVLSSSYGRTQLILLNLTGESLLLGKDQKAGAAAVLPALPLIGLHAGQRNIPSKAEEHVNSCPQ